MENIRYGVWVLYGVCVLAILFASGWLLQAGWWVLGLVALAHFVEFLVKREVMAKAGGSMGHHFVQTMIYGLFHWKPLEDQQNSQEAKPGESSPGA